MPPLGQHFPSRQEEPLGQAELAEQWAGEARGAFPPGQDPFPEEGLEQQIFFRRVEDWIQENPVWQLVLELGEHSTWESVRERKAAELKGQPKSFPQHLEFSRYFEAKYSLT